MSLSLFGGDRRSILSILSDDFLLLRRFYVLFCLYVYVYLGVKEICSSYLDLLKSKNSTISSVYIFDGLYYRPRKGNASKQQGEKLSLITIYFHRHVYIILQTVPVCYPYAQINLLSGKGKTDQKSRTATAQWEVVIEGCN